MTMKRWASLGCLVLALLMATLEATHAHSGPGSARATSHCAICISVHANAPAIAFHPLPTLCALEAATTPLEPEGRGIIKEISLFVRPPPAV
jgi:hypothetical protein